MSHFVSISTVINGVVTDVLSVIMLIKLLVILLYEVFPQVNPQTLDLHTPLLNNKKYKNQSIHNLAICSTIWRNEKERERDCEKRAADSYTVENNVIS